MLFSCLNVVELLEDGYWKSLAQEASCVSQTQLDLVPRKERERVDSVMLYCLIKQSMRRFAPLSITLPISLNFQNIVPEGI